MSVDFESGSSQYIDYGDPGNPFDGLTAFTVAAWVSVESSSSSMNVVSRWDFSGGFGGWILLYSTGNGFRFEATYDATTSEDTLQDPVDVVDGRTYHVAAIWSKEWRGLYVDGTLVDVDTNGRSQIRDNVYDLRIATQHDAGNYWDGEIEDVTCWDVALGGDEVARLAAGETSDNVRAASRIFHCGLDDTTDIDDEINALTGTAYNTPTNGAADLSGSYPTLATTADGDSFFDHLTTGDQLSTATAGSGSASYSDSNLELACGASSGDAAVGYYATPVNRDRSQTWVTTFKYSGSATDSPILYLYDHSSAPTTGTQSTIDGRMKMRVRMDTATTLEFTYWDDSRTVWEWDAAADDWDASGTAFAFAKGDYFLVCLEFDGPGQRWRLLAYHQNASGDDQGLHLFTMTAWVRWRDTDAANDDLYVCWGMPYTDVAANGTLYLESVHRSNGDTCHGWTNAERTYVAFPDPYGIYHHYCYDVTRPFFVPEHRYSCLAIGGSGDWDEVWVKDPFVLENDDDVKWMFYNGRDSSNDKDIGLATSASFYGPWERYASNPLFSETDKAEFPWVVKDHNQAGADRWVMFYGIETATPAWTIYRRSSADGISWSSSTEVLTAGSGGSWDDDGPSVPVLLFVNNVWQMWYSGHSNSSSRWQVGLATSNTLTGSYSKHANNPLVTRDGSVTTTVAAGSSGNNLEVADSTGFEADMPIIVDNHSVIAHGFFYSRVRKVIDADTLELYHAITSPATGEEVNALTQGSISAGPLIQDGADWYMMPTAFQVVGRGGFIVLESIVTYKGTAGDPSHVTTWSKQWENSPPVIFTDFDGDKEWTNENVKLVTYPVPFEIGITATADDQQITSVKIVE